jgi:hypothetical protein
MNKLLGFGIAVLLCMAAAGFGAYLALRQQTTVAAPAAEPASVVASAPQSQPASSAAPEQVQMPAPIQPAQEAAALAAPVVERPKSPAPKPVTPPLSQSQKAGNVSGGAATPPPALDMPPAGNPAAVVPVPEPAQPPVQEPITPQPPPPPQKVLEELVVSAESVIGLRVENTVNSEVARVEDPVEARVTRDVRVGSEIAIPTGSRVLGSVIQVERGGKMKNAARIGVRFHTLVLPDSTRLPIQTEAVYREGKSPGQESAAKVGAAAVGGAILGAIIGGGKGAAIGGAVGAAGGSGAVMAGGRNPAILTAGTALTIRLNEPVTVVIERDELK